MEREWRTQIQSLSNPWSTWLQDTHLLGPSNGTAVLYIPQSLIGLSDDFGLCSKAFGCAKAVHPELQSLIISSDSIYQLVVDGRITLTDVKKAPHEP